MKSSQQPGHPDQSCSCTSCVYRSESERPSIIRIIAGGSRIDKLYYGKYIPLRERKLLDKLVRTRGVYDNIRNQLLSESDVSIKEKANLKPRKHVRARSKELPTDKSSAILEIVEMVDKGKVAGAKNLSECCSCCSCSSKITQSQEHVSRMRRHRHRYGHAHGGHENSYAYSGEHTRGGGRARGGAYTMSRTSMIRKKMGDVRRSVKFKAKSIRSAPCTCTRKLSGIVKRQSQEIIKRLRPGGSKAMLEDTYQETYEPTSGGQTKKRVVQKIKQSRAQLMESMGEGARKIRDLKTRLQEHIAAEGKISLEKIKQAKYAMKENLKTVITKSERRKHPPSEELNFEQFVFPIKKDSITKFKERLRRKKLLQDYYACEPECIPDECVPENCFKIIKMRRFRREKKLKSSTASRSARVENDIGMTSSASSIGVQAQQGTVVSTETDHKQKKVVKMKRPSAEKRITVDIDLMKTAAAPTVSVTKSHKKKDLKLKLPCTCEEIRLTEPLKETKSVKSMTSIPPVTRPAIQQEFPNPKKTRKEKSSVNVGIEIRKAKTSKKAPQTLQMKTEQTLMKKRDQSRTLQLEKGSQTMLVHSIKEAQAGSQALKRCFCTLKLKAKHNRQKPTQSASKHTSTTRLNTSTRKLDQIDKNVKKHVQTKRGKHKKERKPGISAGVGVKPRHKSVSSLTSKSLSTGSIKETAAKKADKIEKRSSSSSRKLEQVVDNPLDRQVVRIGSSFSFSIEFYKDKPNDVTEDRAKKHNRGSGRRRAKKVRHRHSQTSSLTGKSKYTLTKHSLRRCFCTLKLARAKKGKEIKTMTRSQRSFTSQYTPDVTFNVDRGIATNKKYILAPYECDTGLCVPGKCDSHVCQKRISTRRIKHHSRDSNTDNRRTKSTSSLTSRSIPNKAKKVQSSTTSYKSPHNRQSGKGEPFRIRTTPSSPDRQVVRISSRFSFNIEFYKDKTDQSPLPPINDGPKGRPSESTEKLAKPKKDKGYQEKVKKRQKSTSMLVKNKNQGSFIAPAMKRCFCTLKLQKNKGTKQIPIIEQATTGTCTPNNNEVDYKNVLVTKSTKTKQEKRKVGYVLEPYECEPNVCVPGECDQYECLKRIQRRQLRESGTSTEKVKMKSASSMFEKSKFRSKGSLVKSKIKRMKVFTDIKNVGGDAVVVEKPQRQVVRIGSSFSFNIAFNKDKSPSDTVNENENNFESVKDFKAPEKHQKSAKKLKHRGSGARVLSSSHENTQVKAVKQAHKAAGIRPMLKRCFCTLKLQAKNNRKFKTNIKAPKVITVSRVTVTETKIKDEMTLKMWPSKKVDRGLNWATAMYNINSSSTLSRSSIVIQYKEMKSYFRNEKSIHSIISSTLSDKVLKKSPYNKYVHSNLNFPICYSNVNHRYTWSENCILKGINKDKLYRHQRSNLIKSKKIYVKSQKSDSLIDTGVLYQELKLVPSNQIKRQRYFAMNVQVQQNKNAARRLVPYKLKPYECEPGVCVPDECDPYECEKLIKKRLMKKVDRISGKNMRSKSISSYASQSTTNSKTKKLQSRRAPRENAKKAPAGGIKYESMPSRKHKQAVRVGSSFSFNIEFSKDKSSPEKYSPPVVSKPAKALMPTKPSKKVVRAKGTKGYGVGRHDQDSQSMTLTENKGSGMKPMMQRCFCTLKLQKKGRNQNKKKEKPVQHDFDRGTATPPNTLNEFVASRTMVHQGQNTANQKPRKLLPYECEPQVCIPGECDPYECSERIKLRNKKFKDSGTVAMRYKKSSSSNTGQRARTQARHIQSKPRRKQRSRESNSSRRSNVVTYGKPSRNAVRVGSSFSFNVQFFKENSQTSASPPRVIQRESRPSVEKVPKQREQKQKNPKKRVKVVGLQNEKTYKNRPSQIGNVLIQVKSTMTTSFMKRCFCIANPNSKGKNPKEKIRKIKEKPVVTQSISVDSKASQAKDTKSFLKRCFCVLKFKKSEMNQEQKNVQANTKRKYVPEPTTADKNVVTSPYKGKIHNLEPYECEPGVCAPGECNPYECLKLIKTRNVKLDTREAFTDRARTKSTSSSFKSSKTSKARRTQSNLRSPSTVSRQQSTKIVKESPTVEPLQASSNRQVVRIGSNFSFNIEFYKDRSPNTEEVQAAAKAIRRKPPPAPKIKAAKIGKVIKKIKHRGSESASVATYDNEAQAKIKIEDRASGISPALKRCFCTLELQKRNVPPPKYATQKTGTGAMKEIPTHQNRAVMTGRKLLPYECEPHVCVPYECDPYECKKLIKKRNLKETTKAVMTTKEKPIGYTILPYECEPNVCIPGQCNPYECQKRIQLRNMKHRSSGTSTKRHRVKSMSSDIRPTSGKARKVQSAKARNRTRSKSVSTKRYRSKKSLPTTMPTTKSTRQSVQIGSGFSFNIEFSKNKSASRPDARIRPVEERVKHTASTSSLTRQRLAKTKNNKAQYRKRIKDTDSQILAQKMRDTGVNPFLKRCFCTLKLQKSGEMASKHAIGRAARNKNVYLATLLPYECEPGICFPGECDPYECDKRIRRRQMRSRLSGTDKKIRRDSSTSSGNAKYRAAKNQAIRDDQARKRQKAAYAKRDYKESIRPQVSSQSSSRQAVRLGSSFSFDVQFFKSSSSKLQDQPRSTYSRPVKKMEIVKTFKPMKTHTRTKSVTSSNIRRQHHKMQTKGSKTDSKSTGVGPLLKKCFCTLALHKKNQKQKPASTSKTKATYRNDDLSDLFQYSRNIGVETKRKYHKLKPYECEPNVCIPGQCDPYECYERINRRLKDSGTETPRPKRKYASSITSKKAKYKSANTQGMKDKRRREKPTMTSTMRERIKKKHTPRISNETNRQAVRIGSNFSFSMEFYKDRPNAVKIPKSIYKIKDLHDRPKKKVQKKYASAKTSPRHKNVATKRQNVDNRGYDKPSQVDFVKSTTRGTTMGAFIKRCFCTLNLHKKPPHGAHKEKIIAPTPRPPEIKRISAPPDLTRPAMVQTQEKYTAHKTIPYKLKPHECEPNICVPGECDPYACLERIKRRNIRRYSRRVGTHMRSSQVSVSSMASRVVPRTARRVQSGVKRRRMVSQPQQEPRVVEQPRFAHAFESPNRTGVKVGSNISFNIEFYKDRSQGPAALDKSQYEHKRYDDHRPKDHKIKKLRDAPRKSTFSQSRSRRINKGVRGISCNEENCEIQAGPTMQNKAAGVNNMLKRCFCTLKLQKNAMKAQKVITVNRVSIEENYRNVYTHFRGRIINRLKSSSPALSRNKQYEEFVKIKEPLYQQIDKRHTQGIHENHKTRAFNDSKEMKTLFPYTPTKFNKNLSTILLRNTDVHDKLFPCNYNLRTTAKGSKQSGNKTVKYLDQIQKESGMSCHKRSKGKLFLRKLFTRFFSSKLKSEDKCMKNEVVLEETTRRLNISKPDTLKSSKSDRRTTNVKNREVPKKSTSLKVTRVPDKVRIREELNNYHNYKEFSHYQYGDTGQKYSVYPTEINNSITAFSREHNNYSSYLRTMKTNKNTRSPYESNKIVQMALVKNSKSNKANGNQMVNTTTNTQTKKTRTKGVETQDDPNNDSTFLGKCKCLFRKLANKKGGIVGNSNETFTTTAMNKKEASIKNKTETLRPGINSQCFLDENMSKKSAGVRNNIKPIKAGADKITPVSEVKAGDDKKRWDNKKYPKSNDNKDYCPCPNRKRLLLSGDNQIKQQQQLVKGAKGKKDKKKAALQSGDTQEEQQSYTIIGKGKKYKKHVLQSGDAHEIVNDNKENVKSKKDKLGKANAFQECEHPTPCPCCGGMKRPKKSKSVKGDKSKPGKYDKSKLTKFEKSQLTKGDQPKGMTKAAIDTTKSGKNIKKTKEMGTAVVAKGKKGKHGKAYHGSMQNYGAKITIKAKGDPARFAQTHGAKGVAKDPKTKGPSSAPCICGSKICGREFKKMKVQTKKKLELQSKPCTCGSQVCALDAENKVAVAKGGKKKPKKAVCICQETMDRAVALKKAKIAAEKKRIKEEQETRKRFKEQDNKRRKQRLIADSKADKEAKRYKKTADGMLVAESLLDMIKLAVTTGGDITRCASRAVLNPRITYKNMKDLAHHPGRGIDALGNAISSSGASSTCKRMKQRCVAMRTMQKLKAKMEGNPVTYFLLHINDSKKRADYKKKKRLMRKREPIDFECSLFMASLRRRPCLAVYYTCPWFYPHCLSMLNLWKQFTDVMLFLIAVTVWSPCIVAMEMCRAFVCCFFCTG